MKNELTAKRMQLALSNANMIPQELAEKSGVSKSSISQYVNGSHAPSNISSGKIGEVLGVNPLWLMGFDVDMKESTIEKLPKEVNDVTLAEYDRIKKYRFISDHSPDGAGVVDMVLNREYCIANTLKEQKEQIQNMHAKTSKASSPSRIRNYYYRLASAGTGQLIFDTPPTKRIEIPDIPAYRKADYAIGVNGDSMEPVFHDGDMLLIEMAEDVSIGDIGIFRVDNESFVKKLGKTELISLNPAARNIPLNESAGCMGKVIGKLPND